MKHSLDLDHAVVGIPAADMAALLVAQGIGIPAMTLHERVLATQRLELRGRHQSRMVEQEVRVGWRRDAQHRPYLGIRHLATPKGIVDRRELGELCGDPNVLARGDQIPADAPGEPVCARPCALCVPPAAPVELAQVGEEAMHGGVEMRRLFRDLLSQLFELVHA